MFDDGGAHGKQEKERVSAMASFISRGSGVQVEGCSSSQYFDFITETLSREFSHIVLCF